MQTFKKYEHRVTSNFYGSYEKYKQITVEKLNKGKIQNTMAISLWKLWKWTVQNSLRLIMTDVPKKLISQE